MKNIMSRAWEISKEAVIKFGGTAKEYFAQALRMAWAEIKKATLTLEEKIEIMKQEFFCEEKFSKSYHSQKVSRWTKGNNDRLYIPRNAYEQAGYINLNTMEFKASRPGNSKDMQIALDFLKSL